MARRRIGQQQKCAPGQPGSKSICSRGATVPASQVLKKSTRRQLCMTQRIRRAVMGSTPSAWSGMRSAL
jgi:hypothetical protein